MKKYALKEGWSLKHAGAVYKDVRVPGSLYQVLIDEGVMDDPYYRDNELKALEYLKDGCEYVLHFELPAAAEGELPGYRKRLVFEGIDTLSEITLNGTLLGSTDNMHRTWSYDIDGIVNTEGDNVLSVKLSDPVKFIKDENEKIYCGGSHEAMEGFPHLRKAHCMFGWDWGPRLPDMGIFREVYIAFEEELEIDSVYITQEHIREADSTTVVLRPAIKLRGYSDGSNRIGPDPAGRTGEYLLSADEARNAGFTVINRITTPDGRIISVDEDEIVIENARLWWPNGYGDQPLYEFETILMKAPSDDAAPRLLDVHRMRIGLRTMTVNTDRDEWGECFAQEVNGVKLFAMGADYIPECNILPRITPERTRKLLEAAAKAHHNAIRVWGGGYYPDDFFYDICDELGLVVWQDCMFACASYELDEAFDANIRAEIRDNVRRIRHHACLGLWCGNNEMESQTIDGSWRPSIKQKADYIKIFEYIIPGVIREEDPASFYWPSSPSSCGNFDNPGDETRGDAHYWDVWHGCKPFTDYRKYKFRYLSEFGFQSFPAMRTIESFTLPEERNVFSRIMEMHQRNAAANGKIVNYISATYLYPYSLERFVYISQLLQADAIRYGAEHFRRNRGCCMGTVVWQLNDIWPVASWSGIDYFGRKKALHYAEKRMFAPVLISAEEHGEVDQRPFCIAEQADFEKSFRLNVVNETFREIRGTVYWTLKQANGSVPEPAEGAEASDLRGSMQVAVPALSAVWVTDSVQVKTDTLSTFLEYEFVPEGAEPMGHNAPDGCWGTALFTAPKHFRFEKPELSCVREGNELVIRTNVFTKSISIEGADTEIELEDNFFDMVPGEKRVRIVEGDAFKFTIQCVNFE